MNNILDKTRRKTHGKLLYFWDKKTRKTISYAKLTTNQIALSLLFAFVHRGDNFNVQR